MSEITTRMEGPMAAITTTTTPAVAAPEAIRVPSLAWFAAAVGLFVVYLVLQENGALLASSWETVHELFHDGRHAFGVPCH
jgi:hypothetical protein